MIPGNPHVQLFLLPVHSNYTHLSLIQYLSILFVATVLCIILYCNTIILVQCFLLIFQGLGEFLQASGCWQKLCYKMFNVPYLHLIIARSSELFLSFSYLTYLHHKHALVLWKLYIVDIWRVIVV